MRTTRCWSERLPVFWRWLLRCTSLVASIGTVLCQLQVPRDGKTIQRFQGTRFRAEDYFTWLRFNAGYMSQSSWTEMAAGRNGVDCPASLAIALEWPQCAGLWSGRRTWVFMPYALRVLSDNWRRPPRGPKYLSSYCEPSCAWRPTTSGNAAHDSRSSGDAIDYPSWCFAKSKEPNGQPQAGRRLHLRVAIDYSSRDAIARAAAGATASPLRGRAGPSAESLASLLGTGLDGAERRCRSANSPRRRETSFGLPTVGVRLR